MKKTTILVALVALLGMGASQAQSHFSLRFGGLFPSGKYADASGDYSSGNGLNWGLDDNSKKGGAGIGATVGAQFRYDIASVKGLGVLLSVDGMYNSLNSDVRDYYADMVDDLDNNVTEFSVTLPCYINIPIMAGIGYTLDATPNLGVFAEAALGANIRIITNEVQTSYTPSTNYERIGTYTYETATTFAFRLGAGVLINKKFSIGVDYYGLGMAKAQGTTITEINGQEQSNAPKFKAGKITPTNIALRFGINF